MRGDTLDDSLAKQCIRYWLGCGGECCAMPAHHQVQGCCDDKFLSRRTPSRRRKARYWLGPARLRLLWRVAMQMALADAIKLLGVPADFTAEDITAAFRRKAKACHPDLGGTEAQFIELVKARDQLLASHV